MKKGILVVVSGFSGAGKGTIMKKLMSEYGENYALSISATTRAPRLGEEHGKDYFFVTTEVRPYSTYVYDVINKNGEIITSLSCKEYVHDIGEGYVFFSHGNDWGHIMTPEGLVVDLQAASVWPSYCLFNGELEDDDEIGRVKEGLFYGFSAGNLNTVAYYYNTRGEVVIDLSTQAVNFKVTKLSDFCDGQARIEFTGANYKRYYAFIDKTGAFIDEPIEISEE